ncbi:MAG: D-alanyl-D-alanine carboxypeptidase family protein [Anaerovoracaceae bacterium]|jgi:D-alanyl-D-alanine carboxypeptidase (penicillin-binding protein 5/6)
MNMDTNAFFRRQITIIFAVTMLVLAMVQPSFSESSTDRNHGDTPHISATSAILMEVSTGRILYEKNKDQRAYPASTTKIMTALLAIENGDLDEGIKVSPKAIGIEGSSIYLEPGETILLRDLLYGLMLQSGNDAAVAVAEEIGNGMENFVSMMNSRAEAIGAKNTNFVNPSGLYDENHYTTVYDMALIAREAMENPLFRDVSAARSWQAQRTAGKYNFFSNKNKVVYEYNGGTGIKIGYTKRSGRTLVASSERDGMELICVVMNAPDWFQDSYKLMDYGYENFEIIRIIEGGKRLKSEPLLWGEKGNVFIGMDADLYCPIKKGIAGEASEDVITLQYEGKRGAIAPVARWQKAGALALYLNGELLCRKRLYYLEDIDNIKRNHGLNLWWDN